MVRGVFFRVCFSRRGLLQCKLTPMALPPASRSQEKKHPVKLHSKTISMVELFYSSTMNVYIESALFTVLL